MSGPTTSHEAKFRVGQVIHHLRFGYRGVIVDVDPVFQGSDAMARSKPPRDRPWYHVLVHQAEHMTYVAEQNLEPDETGEPVVHPVLDQFFDEMRDGLYVRDRAMH